uniref:Uncharacterized protein n=1 Tax=Romanomermis culicivorax TaxID=13658 RepID=A0A915I577_ROMCU
MISQQNHINFFYPFYNPRYEHERQTSSMVPASIANKDPYSCRYSNERDQFKGAFTPLAQGAVNIYKTAVSANCARFVQASDPEEESCEEIDNKGLKTQNFIGALRPINEYY